MKLSFPTQWWALTLLLLCLSSNLKAQTYVNAGYGGVYDPNSVYTPKPGMATPSTFPYRGFLDNGTTKIGVNTLVGSVIDWVSWDGGRNLINAPIHTGTGKFDAGRQWMVSLYSNPDGQSIEGPYTEQGQSTFLPNGIGWNPVQGGDIGSNPSFGTTLAYYNDNSTIYIKAQGKQWEMQNIPGKAYVESWIKNAPDNARVWRVHHRATLFRDDPFTSKFPSARQQEFPSIYHDPAYSQLLYCQGQPYTNAPLTKFDVSVDQMQPPVFSTEPFVFKKDTLTGRTLVFYSPISGRFVPGRFDTNGSTFESSYIASGPYMNLDHDGVYDVDVAFGEFSTLEAARAWAYTQPRWSGLPEYRFDQNQKSRYGFKLYNCQDQTEKNIISSWNITPIRDERDRRDFDINLPEQWINGRVVKNLYIKGSFTGTTAMWLRWKRAGDNTEHYKEFTVSGNGSEELININMTGVANWDGHDILDCTIKRGQINGTYPALYANEQWTIKWISYRNLDQATPNCNFSVSANSVNVGCTGAVTLNASCSGNDCGGVSYSWSGNGISQTGQSISFTGPASNGTYTYTVTASKAGCGNQTATGTVTVTGCGPSNPPPCTFAQPQRVGTWNGNEVQIRQYGDKKVLVTVVPGSSVDKHYPRGNNFWTDQPSFIKDAGADAYYSCLNGGITDWWGLTSPAGLQTPSGYTSGTESDGSFYFQQTGTSNCNFSVSANSVNVECTGAVTLNASCSGNDCGGVSYSWSGNGISQTGQSISFTGPASNGTYTYTVTASKAGCGNQTATGTVTVTGCGGGSTNPTNGSYEGYLDALDCGSGRGWIWNSSYPNQHIVIEFLEGSTLLATVTASTLRPDLVAAGKGNGEHGYTWPIPSSLKDGQNHTISVRVQGQGYVLTNSPGTINCPSGSRMAAAEAAGEYDGSLSVSPNPATEGRIRVKFGAKTGQTYMLRMVDLSGRTLQNWDVKAKTDFVDEELALSETARGMVVIRLIRDGRLESKKVVIAR